MILDWWNGYLDWAMTPDGKTMLATAVTPFVAVLIAGLVGAMLGRGGIARLIARQDRDRRASVIAAALAATRRAGAWAQLSISEQDHLDYTIAESLAHVRMIPAAGADLAAEWAALKARIVKQRSMMGAGASEQEIRDLEDWLILWHRRPARAARHFADDLETLRYTAGQPVATAAYQGIRLAEAGDLPGIVHPAA